jgi:hypothetical protein
MKMDLMKRGLAANIHAGIAALKTGSLDCTLASRFRAFGINFFFCISFQSRRRVQRHHQKLLLPLLTKLNEQMLFEAEIRFQRDPKVEKKGRISSSSSVVKEWGDHFWNKRQNSFSF